MTTIASINCLKRELNANALIYVDKDLTTSLTVYLSILMTELAPAKYLRVIIISCVAVQCSISHTHTYSSFNSSSFNFYIRLMLILNND